MNPESPNRQTPLPSLGFKGQKIEINRSSLLSAVSLSLCMSDSSLDAEIRVFPIAPTRLRRRRDRGVSLRQRIYKCLINILFLAGQTFGFLRFRLFISRYRRRPDPEVVGAMLYALHHEKGGLPVTSDLRRGFRLDEYRVLPLEGTLDGPGGSQHLQPKVVEVLLRLAETPG